MNTIGLGGMMLISIVAYNPAKEYYDPCEDVKVKVKEEDGLLIVRQRTKIWEEKVRKRLCCS